MLMLTPTAIEVVRSITSADGTPFDAGLRISMTGGAKTLRLAVTATPGEYDRVLDVEGSRIFLDQRAAAFLDDRVLDTGVDPNGEDGFVFTQQSRT
ncbi:hypothetical protein [Nocardia sp. NPDC051570]|uniref:hypothetical protein n=1 Tax=Nocardia sp. NPDC051570 TaxID=3364324 RepID=UPI0037AFCA60